MTLMLHTGAEPIEYDALRQLGTPEPTATHHPLPHVALVEMVKFSLGFYGHEVVDEHHGVTPDGMRYFGLLSLKSTYGDYTDTVGLRNTHDKKYPCGISVGSRVFVCDNLAFSGDQVIKRRHTKKLKHELPSLVASVVEPLRLQRERQHESFERYQATPMTDQLVDMAIMSLYRQRAINVTRIADVLGTYENPPFDWGGRTAWRLFNATTHVLTGRVAENPEVTRTLHNVIDGVCETVH